VDGIGASKFPMIKKHETRIKLINTDVIITTKRRRTTSNLVTKQKMFEERGVEVARIQTGFSQLILTNTTENNCIKLGIFCNGKSKKQRIIAQLDITSLLHQQILLSECNDVVLILLGKQEKETKKHF
jgi:hypothetical protein